MLISADASSDSVPVSIQVQFTLNGEIKYTPYAESLPAGSYRLIFPQTVVIDAVTYTILGNNDFTITHPQNGETYFKASYFAYLPPIDTLIETYRGVDVYRETKTNTIYFRYVGVKYVFSPNTSMDIVRARIDELIETTPPPPNGDGATWPHTEQMHFSETLEGGFGLGASRMLVVGPVDMSVILGGRLDVTITYQSYVVPGVTARIHWNGNLVYEGIVPQMPLVVSIDIAQGSIGANNGLKIGFSQGPLSFSVVEFDVWVTLGYSEPPSVEPGIDPQEDGLAKYLPYIVAGGGALLLIYLLTGRGPSVVVVRKD